MYSEKNKGRVSIAIPIVLCLVMSFNSALSKPFIQKEKFRAEIESEDAVEVREDHHEDDFSSLPISFFAPSEFVNLPIILSARSYIAGGGPHKAYIFLLAPSLLNIPPPLT
ncbi:hypothetical protein EHO61_02455 [Leptospira fluminis]|uniref:Uncharacterized protein n=1 Tax=Leptospira fluminis TaxID=2484979 RepID=A0A4R9GRP3_9LEPT|nr:hypothetical protein [Leptospira fluminis]TGK20751.1 hypothetical protein EHO61_02455 [Leptospira fluminis]